MKKSHTENAQRLRRETDEALRASLPSIAKVKLLVNDLVTQVERLSAAVDRLETLHAQLIEVQDHIRILIDA